LLKNGSRVTDTETWWKRRRPEILNDFLTEIYGKISREDAESHLESMARTLPGFAEK